MRPSWAKAEAIVSAQYVCVKTLHVGVGSGNKTNYKISLIQSENFRTNKNYCKTIYTYSGQID